jgi:ATP-binding cassette, subfamily B, bacterial
MALFNKFPTVRQYDEMDCGPTCLQIICRYYEKNYTLDYLRKLCNTTRAGSSIMGLHEAAEKLHFETAPIKIGYEDLDEDMLPAIAYWNQRHFIVVYKVADEKVYVSDPAHGLITYSKKDFLEGWTVEGETGILLALMPQEEFFEAKENDDKNSKKYSIRNMLSFLKDQRRAITGIMIILLIIGAIQLVFPFTTQHLVDRGINQKDLNYIYVLLLAQFMFFLGRSMAEVVNTYTLLKVGTKLNIRLISNFFEKLFRLPLGYFDVKMSGDILQRISDHSRIEFFLTHGALNIFLSVISLLIFGSVLLWYNWKVFLIFLVGSILYILWFRYFMKKKAELDYKNFSKLSERQDKNLEMIFGMAEIKLNNAGDQKKQQWQQIQQEVFAINFRTLKISQWQQTGSRVINELKNIGITFFSALLVVNNQLSLGEMMAIGYINGQLNGPVSSILDFLQQYQDAQLSAQRIGEIHDKEDEVQSVKEPLTENIPATGDLVIKDLSFKYEKSSYAGLVLKNISLTIPRNKVTAVAGQSGCGKTTLLKLLLKFYEPDSGQILIGDADLSSIPHKNWRQHCGTVLQDAYLFNDTIEGNITLGNGKPDQEQLSRATKTACLDELLERLPLGLYTKIGPNGMQLSGGEKQRVMIARAIYNNPQFVFFDEATSSLDAMTEKAIVNNLDVFFENKTVLVIAHRLSTVQRADQIIVMEKGEIVETGNHETLIAKKGVYHTLVRNQLDLNG